MSVPSVTEKHQNNYDLYYQNTIQDDASITNNDKIHYCETPRKKNYIIPTISTTNHHSQYVPNTSPSILNLNTPTILLPVGKEYMCFQKDGKNSQSTRCIKSRIMTKVVDFLLSIDPFEQSHVSITATEISRTDHCY